MSKKESIIWKKAVANTHLGEEAYKMIVNDVNARMRAHDFPLVVSLKKDELTISNLKKAMHSQYTNPMCRAILISSLFEREEWEKYFNKFKTDNKKIFALYVAMDRRNGELYLRLTDQYHRYPGSSKWLQSNLKVKLPKAPFSGLYLKAVTTGSKKAQKMALWLSEFQVCIYSIVKDIVGIIKATDPLNMYGSDPYDPTEESPKETPETGSLEDSDEVNERFKRHAEILRHTREQLNLLLPQAKQLGIDTGAIINKFDEVLAATDTYIDYEYHQEDLLYNHHEKGQELVELLGSVARTIEGIDLDSELVKSIDLRMSIHKYVPYPTQKIEYYMNSVRDGSAQAIENYATRVLKYADWKFNK